MGKRKDIDLVLILLWPIFATIFSFLFKPNTFGSVILFLGLPSIYLGIRGKEYIKKTALFSFFVGVLTIIVIDYTSHLTGTWFVPSMFPFRLFKFVSVELILWGFFTIFFIVIFYQYFIDKHTIKKPLGPRMKYLIFIALTLFAVFLFFLFYFPSLLNLPYFYMLFGMVLIFLPFVMHLLKYPKVTSRFFLAAAYFFFLHFTYEIAALKLGWWSFPGPDFIGWVSIFGVSFPFEEFLFWFILLVFAVLSYYEYFDDDEK
jgi:hypothetical protein